MKNRNDWRTENFLYCMPIREVINVTRVFRISEKIQTLPFVFKNTCEEKSKDKFYDIFCFSKKNWISWSRHFRVNYVRRRLDLRNFSVGRADRASFITLMTRCCTCFDTSGLTSANTSCEFSFRKLLTVSPVEIQVNTIRSKIFK